MSDGRKTTADARAHTDTSLGVERASSDAVGQRAVARSRRVLDDLVERDRMRADARLLTFRDRADRVVAVGRSTSSVTGSSIRMERLAADESMRNERAVTDEVLERERHRADEAVEVERREQQAHFVEHGAHRRATDEQLLTERSDADAAAVDLDATKDALAQARSEQASRSDVLGVVAHELRSPLSVVVLNAELLAQRSSDPTLRDAAEDTVRAAARMDRLLADLLDVTRIREGTFALEREEHDVGELLAEVLRTYQPLFAARDLTFSADIPAVAMPGSFDHDRIVQVLSNLLANAMKFTPPGGATHLHAQAHGADQIELVLRDNGPGIASPALEHIFERFWRKDRRKTDGAGLGLGIVQRLAQAHGGAITVENAPDGGALFRVTFAAPRKDED